MLTENGLEIDLEAVRDIQGRADVLTVGFTLFPERLLIDTRSRGDEGPLVAIVAPVQTVQERYLWLGKHRGSFGAPEAFSFFVWPCTVRTLVANDVLAPVRARLAQASAEAEPGLQQLLERLLELERQAMRAAVRGDEPWKPLWERR